MKKMKNTVGICLLIAVFFWCGTLISDRQRLRRELIRLHVVAASDEAEDQSLKLQVRDAVTESLKSGLRDIRDVEQAKAYIHEKLPQIRTIAEETLRSLGCEDPVTVRLCQEAFDTRVYDTFTLPAGVYNALRIVIGEGQGKNWWCVVFPEFCLPEGGRSAGDVAAGAGFPEALGDALTEKEGYELRFAILDLMGKLENIFFMG